MDTRSISIYQIGDLQKLTAHKALPRSAPPAVVLILYRSGQLAMTPLGSWFIFCWKNSVLIARVLEWIPSGYLLHSHGKSPFLIGKPSLSMGHLYHGELQNNQRVIHWHYSIFFRTYIHIYIYIYSSLYLYQIYQLEWIDDWWFLAMKLSGFVFCSMFSWPTIGISGCWFSTIFVKESVLFSRWFGFSQWGNPPKMGNRLSEYDVNMCYFWPRIQANPRQGKCILVTSLSRRVYQPQRLWFAVVFLLRHFLCSAA